MSEQEAVEPRKPRRARKTYAQDFVGWKFYATLQFIVCSLPLWFLYGIADFIGDMLFLLEKRSRRVIVDNLRFGPKLEEKTLALASRRVFHNFCMNTIDFLRFQKFDKAWFYKHVKTEGVEKLMELFKRGRGVIIISAHLGNVEVGSFLAYMNGVPMNAISLSHSNPKVEDLFVGQRAKKGLKVILTGGAMEGIEAALNRGEVVGIVADHSYSKRGVEVDFFGRPAIIPKGAAIAALKTNAPIIAVVAVREGRFGFKVIYSDEIRYQPTGNTHADVQNIMQQCVKALEPFIKEYAEQWVLFRRFYALEGEEPKAQ